VKGKILVQLFLCVFTTVVVGQTTSPSLVKKMRKAVAQNFPENQIQLTDVSGDVNFEYGQLFQVLSQKELLLGYAFLGNAPSKTDTFDYLVVFDTTFIIKNIKVLVYREDYGGEIGSKRWLRQFTGKDLNAHFDYGQNIAAISGATISVRSMTRAINSLLSDILKSPLYK
jgi:hypothetical protein